MQGCESCLVLVLLVPATVVSFFFPILLPVVLLGWARFVGGFFFRPKPQSSATYASYCQTLSEEEHRLDLALKKLQGGTRYGSSPTSGTAMREVVDALKLSRDTLELVPWHAFSREEKRHVEARLERIAERVRSISSILDSIPEPARRVT